MKRVLQFKGTDEGYACFENGEKVFEVPKANLQFDVKAFYQAFYDGDKDFDDIEVENCVEEDSRARHVYECIKQLVTKIETKLEEMPAEDVEESREE